MKITHIRSLLLFSLITFVTTIATAAPLSDEGAHQAYVTVEKADGIPQKNNLSATEMKAVYKEAINHPVASLSQLAHYDPTGLIGFCFGRAMTTHLLSRHTGLKRSSMAKLFIVGNMCANPENCRTGNIEWYYHVTTIVKGPANKWYALDPIVPGHNTTYNAPTIPQWIKYVRETFDSWVTDNRGNAVHKAKLYVVPADVVLPDIRVFRGATEEDGSRIIELNFNDSQHGINVSNSTKVALGVTDPNERIRLVSKSKAEEFFLTSTEQDRFDYEKIVINGTDTFNFNDYFFDLMANLLLLP